MSRVHSLDNIVKEQKATASSGPLDMNRVAAVILGGGEGSRLFPLTVSRCKPAVRFAGKYRLIDIPLSNCINSQLHKIFVITQFLSSTLNRHLFHTYHFDRFSSGFLDILSAEQRPSKNQWFEGTADAVRQNLDYLLAAPVDYFLILSGDQLYNMDYTHLVRFARQTDADVVISVLPVNAVDAGRMGVLKVDDDDWITDFYEKPQEKEILDRFKCPDEILQRAGISPQSKRHYLGSMGIYLFKREVLIRLLKTDLREDFGKHIIPEKVSQGKVAAFLYDGYWEDIGTIESFYRANLAMTESNPPFRFYDENNPIYSGHFNLPGPKITRCYISNSIICEGSIIHADEVTQSILGPRTVVKEGTIIRHSYLIGNDFYESPLNLYDKDSCGLSIGENCIIERTIIDKNATIGDRVKLINKANLTHFDGDQLYIRDGVIVVRRGATIPDGFVL